MKRLLKVCALSLCLCAASPPAGAARHHDGDDLPTLRARIRRFAPTVVTADASRLSPGDRRADDERHAQ